MSNTGNSSNSDNDDSWKEKYREMAKNFIPYDPRFPNTNQTKNCQRNYVDYHRCLKAKNGDEDYCAWYKRAYQVLCPTEWYERWDEQMEKGVFPVPDINRFKDKYE